MGAATNGTAGLGIQPSFIGAPKLNYSLRNRRGHRQTRAIQRLVTS